MLNWYAGWLYILLAFVTGAVIGLWFHNDQWLGGYTSFRRRILRLGHIALAALGMMNVLVGLQQISLDQSLTVLGQWGFVVGGISMPLVCFLSAYRKPFRHLFFIPVTSLIVGVVEILKAGIE